MKTPQFLAPLCCLGLLGACAPNANLRSDGGGGRGAWADDDEAGGAGWDGDGGGGDGGGDGTDPPGVEDPDGGGGGEGGHWDGGGEDEGSEDGDEGDAGDDDAGDDDAGEDGDDGDDAGDDGDDAGDDGDDAGDDGDDAGDAGDDGDDEGDAGDDGDDDGDDGGDGGDGADEACVAATHWKADDAEADPTVAAFGGGHAVWAPGFFCDGVATWSFDGVTLTPFDDGSTLLYGSAHVLNDGCDGSSDGDKWMVAVWMDPASALTGPKLELLDPASDQPPELTDTWLLHILRDGDAWMWDAVNGESASLSHRPSDETYGFQVGEAANGKNLALGASGWFFYEHYLPDGEIREGIGDINVDLECKGG